MINDLIVSIGRQLNIPQSDDNEWVCRVVYSVAGQMALASLWDHTEVQFLFSTSKAELARFLMLMKAFIRRLDFSSRMTRRI